MIHAINVKQIFMSTKANDTCNKRREILWANIRSLGVIEQWTVESRESNAEEEKAEDRREKKESEIVNESAKTWAMSPDDSMLFGVVPCSVCFEVTIHSQTRSMCIFRDSPVAEVGKRSAGNGDRMVKG